MSEKRARFEAWARHFKYDLTRMDASYVNEPYAQPVTDWSWLAWQAASRLPPLAAQAGIYEQRLRAVPESAPARTLLAWHWAMEPRMDELKYTERQLQDKLSIARGKAWRDLTRRLTFSQRQQLANDLAHDFTITAFEVEDRYGHRPRRIEGGVSREMAIKAMDEARAAERAARNAGVAIPDGGNDGR